LQVVEPPPIGIPLCAYAKALENISAAANAIAVSFAAVPFG
jgi:hypothetical protein